ncbi:hypothetical protein BCR37DRAFT_378409 [Protomyces lactucae-debilis]|uniref:Bms1-type G domain-containing protein n=1 Tax=Protomyces lactucae-debilis TaxID=2754530 RepID=A0A1Y2FK80_PROLT|nr:uncharacterized protein BCR37DRAFT_378409 [Protomyces lactucae-debilis]ORY84383.1 hypothetical protein BCR37DRAFT_378409 [Protomyces lactucae-debilis]
MAHSHRPTTKQKHKAFKGTGHASSRTQKDIAKGKIQPEKAPGLVQKTHSKADRKNLAKQIQQNKKTALKQQSAFFGDGRSRAPRIVALIPLNADADTLALVHALEAHLELPPSTHPTTEVHVKNFKQRLQFVHAGGELQDVLNIVAVADYCIFVAAGYEALGENSQAQRTLRALQSQGIPSHFTVLQQLDNDKAAQESRKVWEADMQTLFPTEYGPFSLDASAEVSKFLGAICNSLPDSPTWRLARSYIVPSAVTYTNGFCVEGIVRGNNLDADRLIHIPGLGDFEVDRITDVDAEQVLGVRSDKADSMTQEFEMEEETPFAEEPRKGVRLDNHYYVDSEEEEIPVVKRVPKGTSKYQASWIVDEAANAEDVSDEEVEELEDDRMSDVASTYAPTQAEEPHEELSVEEEARQLASYRAQVKDDKEFPDEVDFDPSINARDRFRKYRGLKDFHQSEWDPDEIDGNTPAWYSGIAKFGSYKSTRNRILKSHAGVPMGTRVKVYLKEVPAHVQDLKHLVLWANREHEQSRAINNFTIQLEPGAEPLKSKEEIVIQCAHRRFVAQPIYSQAIAKTRNGLVRFERFVQPGRLSYATVAGPAIMEKGAPVLYFKRTLGANNSTLELVGTGSFVGVDHGRLTIKRILLSGVPYKIHKRLVTVRYMFHNREDIRFFKAIQLFSKYGRVGFIKEALGTHGYMKTTWDKQIQGLDTVLMPLYKRIYPREAHYLAA